MLAELSEALATVEGWADVRALVVSSATPKAFAAGADIREIAELGSAHRASAFAASGQAVFQRLAESRVISIAAVQGYALGGGLELALACDLRILGAGAQLGLPETGLGIIPGFGGTQRLPRLVGESRALWMILTGSRIDAATAERWGIAHTVVADERLGEEAVKLAETLARGPALALELAKKAVRTGSRMDLTHGLTLEATLFGLSTADDDAREGTAAFLERRRANFRNAPPAADDKKPG
jgi:enoyl-CoA hydratase